MTPELSVDHPALVATTGAGIRVAVIDSGVAAGHPHVGAVGTGVSLVGDDPTDVADRLGHGTAVFAAIREKVPGATLLPVRVLDRQLATSARVLARGIDWAVAEGVAVVNVSFGTTNEDHRPLFEGALVAAQAAGVVVVAAHSLGDVRWLPGSMQGTVGVVSSPETSRNALRVVRSPSGPVIAASPYPRPIDGVPVERNLSGVSFAVANATGIIARALEAGAPRSPLEALLAWIEARTLPAPPSLR